MNTTNHGKTNISFTFPGSQKEQALEAVDTLVKKFGATALMDENIAKVSLVGTVLKSAPGVAAKAFGALAENHINILNDFHQPHSYLHRGRRQSGS